MGEDEVADTRLYIVNGDGIETEIGIITHFSIDFGKGNDETVITSFNFRDDVITILDSKTIEICIGECSLNVPLFYHLLTGKRLFPDKFRHRNVKKAQKLMNRNSWLKQIYKVTHRKKKNAGK
jgi:hypothetical protein